MRVSPATNGLCELFGHCVREDEFWHRGRKLGAKALKQGERTLICEQPAEDGEAAALLGERAALHAGFNDVHGAGCGDAQRRANGRGREVLRPRGLGAGLEAERGLLHEGRAPEEQAGAGGVAGGGGRCAPVARAEALGPQDLQRRAAPERGRVCLAQDFEPVEGQQRHLAHPNDGAGGRVEPRPRPDHGHRGAAARRVPHNGLPREFVRPLQHLVGRSVAGARVEAPQPGPGAGGGLRPEHGPPPVRHPRRVQPEEPPLVRHAPLAHRVQRVEQRYLEHPR